MQLWCGDFWLCIPLFGISCTYRTDAKGIFISAPLPAGVYELSAQLMNAADVRIRSIRIATLQPRAVEIVMNPSVLPTRIASGGWK
jgi:hypothetical protein